MKKRIQEIKQYNGEEVFKRRRSLGLSQEQLANKVGCTRKQIASVEKAYSNYTIDLWLGIDYVLSEIETHRYISEKIKEVKLSNKN